MGPTSGQNEAKKTYLAVSTAAKTAIKEPSSYLSDSLSRQFVNRGSLLLPPDSGALRLLDL